VPIGRTCQTMVSGFISHSVHLKQKQLPKHNGFYKFRRRTNYKIIVLNTVTLPSQVLRLIHIIMSWDISVAIASRLRAGRTRSYGSIPGRGKRFFSFPQRPDRLWGPPRLLHQSKASEA
jgi:hypothetical protein